MPYEYNPSTDSFEFILKGVIFSKVIKQKISDGSSKRARERVITILPELIPLQLSSGCTSSKISVPIPNQPALRIRMGFQGPTIQFVTYLHTYETWKNDYPSYYNTLCMTNFYDTWKWDIEMEDLLKVADTSDTGTISDGTYETYDANPKNHNFGDPISCDLDTTLFPNLPTTSYSALLQIKPGSYWWVRKRSITRESGWIDKFKLELELERSWQWSTSGRPRPSYDIDVMECFKDGESGYIKMTTEYSGDS